MDGSSGSGVAQHVQFCRTDDGVRLAWARHGAGPPLLVVSCWLSHLEHDWDSPVWRHFLDDLGDVATVVRYDERGFGLSDWDVSDFSLERRVADLETLVEATGLARFAVMGMSGGAPVALAYAHRHPERVTRMVLYGGTSGDGQTQDDEAEAAFVAMIRAGWARKDPIFRRVFTTSFIPDANEQQMSWMDELQRTSTNTANAVESRVARQQVDVSRLLPGLDLPTLVLHARDDRVVAGTEGVRLASAIPGARLVLLDSRNHILLADEPAWTLFRQEVAAFLAEDRRVPTVDALSAREREILLLAADGLDNTQIAQRLTLSVRTVERHLQNVYLKLGLSGRTARAAAVARVLS